MVLGRLAFWSWRRFVRWWLSRQPRLLLGGLPALLAGLGALAWTAVCLAVPAEEVEARYLDQAKVSFAAKDYAGAQTCYERLAPLGKERPAVVYGLARTAEALGQPGRAAALMDGLAPRQGQGYGPAHVWQAARLLGTAPLTAEDRDLAESHLHRALDGELDDREAAHALLGEIYLATRRLDKAEPHLLKAAKTKPQVRLRLAVLYAMRGDLGRARAEAKLAVGYFRAWAKADLQAHRARVRWADALAFLEEFPEAVAVLQEGWNATHEPAYRLALAGAYAAWADVLARDPKASMDQRLRVLEQALAWSPDNPALLERLLAATRVGGADADKARATLRGLLAGGRAPASVHFALGLDAWERGRADEARLHWERALELAPHLAEVANNLAWLLARADPPDLPRALELVNRALERVPHEPRFLDTRGHILARTGKWKEALDDLEKVLLRGGDGPDLHRTLADVYAHLGDPGMAAEHRRRAEEKAAAKPANGRAP
jgi:tetratricopeptide (TPR) repeat protein